MHKELDFTNEDKNTETKIFLRSDRNESPDSFNNSFSRLGSAWLVYSGAEHQRDAKALIQIRLQSF